MKRWFLLIFILSMVLTGCSDVEEEAPKDLVELKGAMVLEVSLLGEHKHVTVRTIDEKVVVINVTWDHMPQLQVGEPVSIISYSESDKSLYSYTPN